MLWVTVLFALHYEPASTDQKEGCGSQLAAAAAKAADTDCASACTGNSTEACGGGSRLSLFYSSEPVGPQPNPGVDGWSSIGCYSSASPPPFVPIVPVLRSRLADLFWEGGPGRERVVGLSRTPWELSQLRT